LLQQQLASLGRAPSGFSAKLFAAMTNLRGIFSLSVIILATLTMLVAGGKPKLPAAKTCRAYVGTYTAKTSSKGIYEFAFDPSTGKMSALELAGESRDPSWVLVHPNGKFLYAANEHGKDSTISAFAIDRKSGKLTLLNLVPALGEDPCHLAFDRTGKFLLTANYTSGNLAVFPILPDGKLGEPTANVTDDGTPGPNKERQEGPHAHWVAASEHNRLVYAADLGLDKVLVYKFDPSKGTLIAADAARAKPGTGPRHVAFSRGGGFMYVLGELDSTVTVFRNDHQQFASVEKVPMLPAGFSGRNDASEIAIHPSGKFLYAANRGHDSIVAYAIDPQKGVLTQVADVLTGGQEPRHFAIDPTGQFLLAENQNSNTIVEFKIDSATGKLTPTGQTLSVPSPICISYLALE
jgi:6-phosphogluconolactonase